MADPLQRGGPHPLQTRPVPIVGAPPLADEESDPLSPLSDLGSDEDAPRRLVADPDSPTSRLLERAAQRSLASSARNTPEKFSYIKDIARNPEVARAARRALSSSPCESSATGGGRGHGPGGNGGMHPLQSSPELDSLTAVIDHLDRDAGQESAINQQMAAVMLGRLQSGRAGAERTLGVLQAFAAAEAAYARALASVAKLTLCSEADGPSLRAALEQFSDLPMLMGTAHSSVSERLTEAIKGLQSLTTDLRAACEEVGHGAARAKREVDGSRQGLKAALKSHQEACQTAGQRQRQGAKGRGVDSDPWLTEGCLVEQQVRLQRAQHVERQYLAKAFHRVGELELRRAAAVQHTLGTFLRVYRSADCGIQQIAGALEELLRGIDAEADLETFTETAASSVHSAEALSARQREAVDQICSELLGSAEIVRQGTMERWDSSVSRWQSSHLVLSQAGFLHCFALDSAVAKAWAGSVGSGSGGGSGHSSPGQLCWGGAHSWTPPVESMNLSRCSFEEGEAPVFRIIEASGGGLASFALFSGRQRTLTLKAGDVEECMDWAIAVRESIAAC
ncbi:hypothetical protein D9Q98_004997 [Chlorella vulgaris]|uniref:PH domain-containing protein n=1 Tax=Chlorella vulgaris TaxID=3077 RepID=A0A9D4TNA9_CHLVU|nr:hypothetical protein D9Q98_004997 [Chlorella vulgaris]